MGVLDERQPLLKFVGLGLLDGDLRVRVLFEGVGMRLEWMGVLFEWMCVLFEWMCVWFEWMCVGIQLGLYGLEVRFQFGFGVTQFSPYIFSLDYLYLRWLGPNRCFEGRKVSKRLAVRDPFLFVFQAYIVRLGPVGLGKFSVSFRSEYE